MDILILAVIFLVPTAAVLYWFKIHWKDIQEIRRDWQDIEKMRAEIRATLNEMAKD